MAPLTNDRFNESFLSDLENWCLGSRWDARVGLPRGKSRHLDPLWREVVLAHIGDYPRQSWEDYVAFCEAGRGDEWFQMDEADENDYIRSWRCTCENPFCHTLVNGETAGDLHGGGAPLGAGAPNESCTRRAPDHRSGGG